MKISNALFAAAVAAAAAAHAEDACVGTWWHWMNGHVTREGIVKDLDAMKAAGVRNATLFNAYRPFTPQFGFPQVAKENVREIDESVMPSVSFSSMEWFEMFRFALDEAAKRGITIGAANCDGWSESGGPWITPELSMKELIWCREGEEFGDKVRNGFCRDIATVEANGRKYRFAYTTTGSTNHPASPEGKGLECDKMDPAALEWHFRHYPQWLVNAAGEHAGRTFGYFLVDSWECGFQTWTEKLPEEFIERRGYNMIPWLPVLAGETVGSREDSEAFLHDYRLTCSDLLIDCYFKRLAELCHERGMKLYSEGIYGWDNLPPVDVLRTYKYCDVPMSEFWAKVAAHSYPFMMNRAEPIRHFSPQHAAVLYGKPVVAGEAGSRRFYDDAGGTITFESDPDIRPIPINKFHSLTEEADPDIKYYCGVLRYDFSLDIPTDGKRYFLTLPQFGATAEVKVNGRLVGTIWDPYAPLEITSAIGPYASIARFSIRVANPWRNRLIGDLFQDRGRKAAFTTSPGIDKYDMKPHISRSAELIPTGIARPIVITTCS